ncbi:uncharacterized protein LOC107271643 [Cephus cinctus]|uniref:Uncharacterized protein LOC107271643 n=1 Tax=Cephus cinctus TaxID=211228 RepID=A0AAJ7C730_CEPCN|nr:uncharacterized protein LOC107271643 [Cephus cinctus]
MTVLKDMISKSTENAMERLKEVLEVARQHELIINWGKCRFLQTEIEYLGHIVSKETVRPSEIKTKVVANFPKPTTVKKVQSFLGLTGYFRKFIQGYAKIARPALKTALASGPVLI